MTSMTAREKLDQHAAEIRARLDILIGPRKTDDERLSEMGIECPALIRWGREIAVLTEVQGNQFWLMFGFRYSDKGLREIRPAGARWSSDDVLPGERMSLNDNLRLVKMAARNIIIDKLSRFEGLDSLPDYKPVEQVGWFSMNQDTGEVE